MLSPRGRQLEAGGQSLRYQLPAPRLDTVETANVQPQCLVSLLSPLAASSTLLSPGQRGYVCFEFSFDPQKSILTAAGARRGVRRTAVPRKEWRGFWVEGRDVAFSEIGADVLSAAIVVPSP
jgi:hypothetical protein